MNIMNEHQVDPCLSAIRFIRLKVLPRKADVLENASFLDS